MEIDKEIIRQIKAVRDSGLVNMMDKKGVLKVADSLQYYELVGFLEVADNKQYLELLEMDWDKQE